MNVQTLRKALASFSALAIMVGTFIVPGMGVNKAQAVVSTWAQKAVNETVSQGIFTQEEVSIGTAGMPRIKFVKLLLVLNGLIDASATNQEVEEMAVDLDILRGQNNDPTQINPLQTINRAEAVVISQRKALASLGVELGFSATGSMSGIVLGSWYQTAAYMAVRGAVIVGLMINGVPNFAPEKTLNWEEGITLAFQAMRAELFSAEADFQNVDVNVVSAASIAAVNAVDAALGLLDDVIASLVGNGDVAPPPPVTGSLNVELAANQPTGSIVAGSFAELMRLEFTGTGTLVSLNVKRGGISDQNTLINVFLYDGVARLTDGFSFNSNGELMMNNINFAITGGRTLSLWGEVAPTTPSGQTIFLTLTAFNGGVENLVGNLLTIASGSTLATVGLSGANSVAAATVNAGTTSYPVWRQVLQVNTRTVSLESANFRITGSAPSDALENVNLYVDGVKVGTATMSNRNGSDYLVFDMTATPVSLTTGAHTLEVRADIVNGSSDTFTVQLQQASDIRIRDPQVGVIIVLCGNVACTATFTASSGGLITIGAGTVTANIDPAFNSMTNITGGASNVPIASFKLRAYGEDVKVNSLIVTPFVTLACTAGATYGVAPCDVQTAGATHTQFPTGNGLQNVTLYYNGSQVGSQVSWGAGALTFNLGSQMILLANEDAILEVRADIRTSPGSAGAPDPTAPSGVNYTAGNVGASITAGSTTEGQESHTTGTITVTTGNTLTMQTGLLAVARSSGFANQTANPNTAGVKIGSYVLQNVSTSEGIRVTSLFVISNLGTAALTNQTALRTSETSGSGAVPQNPNAAGNTFSVDFILAPGATKTIDIFADTGGQTVVTVITSLTVNGFGVQSNTTVTVGPITGQTISLSVGTLSAPTILSSTSTQAQYIAAGDPGNTGIGAVDAQKISLSFVSTGGSSTITELKFTIAGGTTPVTTVRIGSVTAPVVGGVAYLTGLSIPVPDGGSGANVDAFVSFSPVGTNGETPNTAVTTTVTFVKYTSGGTTTTITPAVAAPIMTLVGSEPSLTLNSSFRTGLILGTENKIGEVTIAADAKGNIKINNLVFNMGSSSFTGAPTLTNVRIANGSTTIAGSGCVAGPAATSSQTIFCEFGSLVDTFATDETGANEEDNTDYDGFQISAGTSQVFSLFATVNGTSADQATISTSVNQSLFNWDDTSTNGVSGKNLTGTLVLPWPFGSYTVSE